MSDKKYDDEDVQRYIGIVVEEIKNEFRAGFEAIGFIKEQVEKIPAMEARLEKMSSDNYIFKELLKTHDKEIKHLQIVAHSH